MSAFFAQPLLSFSAQHFYIPVDVWLGSPIFQTRFNGQRRFTVLVLGPSSIHLIGRPGFYENVQGPPGPNTKVYYKFWHMKRWVNGYDASRALDPDSKYSGPNTFNLTS